ncbi:MAG: hypothetical protein ACFFA8_06690 [Promethearchaeota archaeon]
MVIIKNLRNEVLDVVECPCPKEECSNHGKCEECIKYHSISNGLPFCQREHGFFTKIFYRRNYQMVQKLKNEGII